MDEQGEPGEYRFSFTLERRELEESLSYAMDRVLMERLPAAQRMFVRNGTLLLVVALLAAISLFIVRPESLLFSVALAGAVLAGIYAYAYLRMAPRETMLREWKKQAMGHPDDDTMAYLLQPCDVVFTQEGITIDHPDVRNAYSWRGIRSIEPAAMSIAIQFRNQGVYAIPKRLFDDDASCDRFLETVRAWHKEARGPEQVAMG